MKTKFTIIVLALSLIQTSSAFAQLSAEQKFRTLTDEQSHKIAADQDVKRLKRLDALLSEFLRRNPMLVISGREEINNLAVAEADQGKDDPQFKVFFDFGQFTCLADVEVLEVTKAMKGEFQCRNSRMNRPITDSVYRFDR